MKKTLLNILGLSILSLNNLYSQNECSKKSSENLTYKTSIEHLAYEYWHPTRHSEALKKYTPIIKGEQEVGLFSMLNSGLKEYLNKIYIIDEKDFFDSSLIGHTHYYSGSICLAKKYNSKDFFHEVGHVRHSYLDYFKLDFSKKWNQISNFKYGEKKANYFYNDSGILIKIKWKDGTDGPKNGCLNSYSAKSVSEDVATFVECLGYLESPEGVKKIYDQQIEKKDEILKEGDKLTNLFLNPETYCAFFPLYFADTTDHRYQKKLDLLKEYEFFTKEEHEKLSKNLGSLNYLLKEETNNKQ